MKFKTTTHIVSAALNAAQDLRAERAVEKQEARALKKEETKKAQALEKKPTVQKSSKGGELKK